VEVHRFAENLRAAIAVPAKYKGRICQVGASIGISFWCQIENLAVEQALLDADTALEHFAFNRFHSLLL
jgi:GGDEF domain-containing protein